MDGRPNLWHSTGMGKSWKYEGVLENLEGGHTFQQAARCSRLSRQAVWKHIKRSPEFCEAVTVAREKGRKVRDYLIWVRHPFSWATPVYEQGAGRRAAPSLRLLSKVKPPILTPMCGHAPSWRKIEVVTLPKMGMVSRCHGKSATSSKTFGKRASRSLRAARGVIESLNTPQSRFRPSFRDAMATMPRLIWNATLPKKSTSPSHEKTLRQRSHPPCTELSPQRALE